MDTRRVLLFLQRLIKSWFVNQTVSNCNGFAGRKWLGKRKKKARALKLPRTHLHLLLFCGDGPSLDVFSSVFMETNMQNLKCLGDDLLNMGGSSNMVAHQRETMAKLCVVYGRFGGVPSMVTWGTRWYQYFWMTHTYVIICVCTYTYIYVCIPPRPIFSQILLVFAVFCCFI